MIEYVFLLIGIYFGIMAMNARLIEQGRIYQCDDFEDHSGVI